MSRRRRQTAKDKWVEKHFPEYLHDGRRIFLTNGKGRITSKERSRETAPWEWAPNVADGKTINMRGYIVSRETIPVPPYYKLSYTKVSDDRFQSYCDSLNFFRNGGKAMDGNEGLDPRELIGGVRGWWDDEYACNNGMYTTGLWAEFNFFDGRHWEHDTPSRYDSWK